MIFSTVRFWVTAGLLLSAMGTVQVLSALRESQTWDEAFELGAGYNYWKTGVYRFNLEQPPVGKLISSFPLLFFNPSIPVDHPSYTKPDDVEFGHEFLYRNRLPADWILFVGRLGTITLTLLLGLVLALWSRRTFGEPSALFALTLFAFDPNLIAHGRYATTDLAAAAFIFFACIAWAAFLEAPGKGRLAVAGIMLGLALATKHSALLLIPIFLCLHAIRRGRARFFTTWTAMAVLSLATIVITYVPEAKMFVPGATKLGLTHPALPLAAEFINRSSIYGELLFQISRWLSLAPNSYIIGLSDFFNHNAGGHPSYLLGAFSTNGWWYYFPVVFLVKTPSAALLTLEVLCLRAARLRVRPNLAALPLEWFCILLPIVVLFGASMTSHIDIGVRHLLPIYPFLYIAIGAGLFQVFPAASRRRATIGAGLILGLLIVESCITFPNHLAFFNLFCGGVKNGPMYLLESNIDWGQDLKKLRAFLKPYGNAPVCLEYFGNADLEYYGFSSVGGIPWTNDASGRERINCIAAISVNLLYGLYVDGDVFSWLRDRKPLARVGGSIYVYDLRKEPRRVP
jgi:hypothetical protein